jgi:hypothetical protein
LKTRDDVPSRVLPSETHPTEDDSTPLDTSNHATTRDADDSIDDSIEGSLAIALTEAAKAGRFDVVAQIAKELEARRLAQSQNVVPLLTGRADTFRGRNR